MSAQAPHRRSIRSMVLVIAAVIFVWTIYQEFRPHTEVGKMEYRMITGYQDSVFEIIMMETEEQFTVLNASFKGIFENNDAEVISRPEQLELLQSYNNLEYRVSVYLQVEEEQAQFRLSRENFNKIQFGKDIKFEVDRKVRDSISSILQL